MINQQKHKYHECVERAHVNIITCTVCKIAESWTDQFIDIIISWTGFDFNGIRPVKAAEIVPLTADISSDDSICYCWVSTTDPQWEISATTVQSNTCVWDLNIQAVIEQTIPAAPGNRDVTHGGGICVTGRSPWIIQHSVVVAGVNRENCNENIKNKERRQNVLLKLDKKCCIIFTSLD